jgi:8-oxo-dGTP pyrophosphatase MutT (NUDIX family)
MAAPADPQPPATAQAAEPAADPAAERTAATSATEAGPVAVPRPAATVVLMRDRAGGAGRRGRPEVLLVERHGASAFGAGAYVFPGGIVEPGDGGPEAARLSPGLTPAQAAARMPDLADPHAALGHFVAAIRETFEEALVLLAEAPEGAQAAPAPEGAQAAPAPERAQAALPSTAELEAVRARLHAGTAEFVPWLAQQGLRLATQRLVYFAHWITPEGVPLRFSARFFLVRAPEGAEVVPDRQEVLQHRWLEPAEAIAMRARGAIHLMDPTVRNLELLGRFASTDEAVRELGRREVRAIQPKLRRNADGTRRILYPWDPDYGQA